MGGELVDSSPEEDAGGGGDSSTLTFKELFSRSLPIYMVMGMSPEQFWEGDVELVKAYREYFRLKQEKENEAAWIRGLYVYQAILSAAPRLNSIKPMKPDEYPSKPFEFTKRSETEPQKESKDNQAIAMMSAWASKVNNKWKTTQ